MSLVLMFFLGVSLAVAVISFILCSLPPTREHLNAIIFEVPEKSEIDSHYFASRKFLLEDIVVPEDFTPKVYQQLIEFFGNKNGIIKYESVSIDEEVVSLTVDGKRIELAYVHDSNICWQEVTPDWAKEMVIKILYGCTKILEAGIAAECNKLKSDDSSTLFDYQGVWIKEYHRSDKHN